MKMSPIHYKKSYKDKIWIPNQEIISIMKIYSSSQEYKPRIQEILLLRMKLDMILIILAKIHQKLDSEVILN